MFGGLRFQGDNKQNERGSQGGERKTEWGARGREILLPGRQKGKCQPPFDAHIANTENLPSWGSKRRKYPGFGAIKPLRGIFGNAGRGKQFLP